MRDEQTIAGESQAGNVIRCERIQTIGISRHAEDDYDLPNVLSCEKCDARYALFLRDPMTDSFDLFWDKWVVELRTAVTNEHDSNHPTTVFFHDGTIVPAASGTRQIGRWLRS